VYLLFDASQLSQRVRSNGALPVALQYMNHSNIRALAMKCERYSYRNDPAVPNFEDDAPLIIFDGECVLCSGGVQWMLARDQGGHSRFAAIQETIPRALYAHYDLDADRFDTFMVLHEGKPYVKWAGLLAAARIMPAPWSWLGFVGHIVPRPIGDAIYDFIQRNRLAWFGSHDRCYAPDPASAERFLTLAAPSV
jgi:predicted DCC family thiol-disulfide oxidoreductase YuxK